LGLTSRAKHGYSDIELFGYLSALFCRPLLPGGMAARVEFITAELQGGSSSIRLDDYARYHQLHWDAAIEQHGPLDGYVKNPSRHERLVRGESEPRTTKLKGTARASGRRTVRVENGVPQLQGQRKPDAGTGVDA